MKFLFSVFWAAICGAVSIYTYLRLQKSDKVFNMTSVKEQLAMDWKIWLPVCILCSASGGVCGFYTVDNTDLVNNLKLLIGLCVLIAAALYDYRSLRIPNAVVIWLPAARLFFLVIELLIRDVNLLIRLKSSVIGALFCLIVLVLFSRLSKGGIGMGDVKLLSGLGFLLGLYSVIYILVLSCIASFILAVILLITGKRNMKDVIPMAPAILIGYVAVLILGLY